MKPRRFRFRWRRAPRWLFLGCGIIWFTILTVAGFIFYLNQIGLPEFLRRPLIDQLRENNLASEFTRLRWRFHLGLVVDQLRLRRLGEAAGEELEVREARLQLDWSKAGWFKWPEVQGLLIQDGHLRIPLGSNASPSTLAFEVTNLHARLRFVNRELWEIEDVRGRTLGAQFVAAGSLTNASRLRSSRPNLAAGDAWKRDLIELMRWSAWIRFRALPTLTTQFHLDLRHPESATARLQWDGSGLEARGIELGPYRIEIAVNEAGAASERMRVKVDGNATNFATPWFGGESVHLELESDQTWTNARPERIRWKTTVISPSSAPGRAQSVSAHGTTQAEPDSDAFLTHFSLQFDNPVAALARGHRVTLDGELKHEMAEWGRFWPPENVHLRLQGESLESRWAWMDGLTLEAKMARRPKSESRPTQPWWDEWFAEGSARAQAIRLRQGTIPEAEISFHWRDQTLELIRGSATVWGETITAKGSYVPDRREMWLAVSGRVAVPKLVAGLDLPEDSWVRRFQWNADAPAVAQVRARAILPKRDAVQSPKDWLTRLWDRVGLEGEARLTDLSYRGVSFESVEIPFVKMGGIWEIPQGRIQQTNGSVDFSGQTDGNTFTAKAKTSLYPPALGPLLGDRGVQILERFSFGTAPEAEAIITGHWTNWSDLAVTGHLLARDLGYLNEHADALESDFQFSDGWIRAGPVSARQGTNTVESENISYNFADGYLHFTNTVTSIAPAGVMKALGPRLANSFEPFQFTEPPRVIMNGTIPTRETRTGAAVRFDVDAPFFRWRFLAASNVVASFWWRDGNLIVTNLVAGFHGGRISGNLSADILDTNDTVFRFDAVVAESQIRSFLNDITPQTNRIEGWLSGRFTVIEAHSRTNGSWNGSGTARLRDGFLWNMPLFGGVSKMLDRVVPGLGQARFKSGSATFVVTNRAVVTSDLELRSPTVYLGLSGKVDFNTQLNGRLVATILRDVPLFGPVVSFVLKPVTKLLEYDVKGHLDRPEMELRYIPEFLLAPLHPVETLRDLLPGEWLKSVKPLPSSKPELPPSPPAPNR